MTAPLSAAISRGMNAARSLLGDDHARAPLMVSLAGVLLLLALYPLSTASICASALLIAFGIYTARNLTAVHAQAIAKVKHESQHEIDRIAEVCSLSAPLWVRQIETVRDESDREIAELTRVFGQITRRLEKALATPGLSQGGSTNSHDILSTLDSNGAQLDRLVDALNTLQSGKERIVSEIGMEAARLKECAAEIRQIALHTRMVALNATIEAARAGPAGKPFAVIVADVREVATRTAEASEQFSRQTDRLHAMVSAAFDEQAGAGGNAVSMQWAQELVQQVVESFEATAKQLTRAIETMAHERQDVREDVSRVLVALQFQDRVSQILAHVSLNLQELQRHMEDERSRSMDARQWLELMGKQYSTPEEFSNLDATQPVVRSDSEVTFF